MPVVEPRSSETRGTDAVRIGLLGYGNVGVAFTQLIDSQAEAIALRTGLELRVTRIAVQGRRQATARLGARRMPASGSAPTPPRS